LRPIWHGPDETDDAARMLAARRWARDQYLPRFVFVRVPVEVKPFYVDFDSLIYLSLCARAIRRTREQSPANPCVTVSEMLPDHAGAWLSDAEERRYTSELRLVVADTSLDDRPPRAAAASTVTASVR
jgi:hypothetical protein